MPVSLSVTDSFAGSSCGDVALVSFVQVGHGPRGVVAWQPIAAGSRNSRTARGTAGSFDETPCRQSPFRVVDSSSTI